MKIFFRSILVLSFIGVLSYGFHLFSKSEDTKKSNTVLNGQFFLPRNLLDTQGNTVSSDKLEGKYLGLYFSASWCGPCRTFTPKLVKFRDQNIESFEVILVGSDGSAKAQANYMKKYNMPWFALENQSEAARNLSLSLDVEYIPYLVILDPQGNLITKKGKQDIASMGKNAFLSWKERTK